MFVIFGWGFTTTHVFGAVFPLVCPNCHNEEFWILKRIRRWFTLFFIPVFPYESTHALMCPICGVGRELHGVELKRAKMFAVTNEEYQAGTLQEKAHMARLEAIGAASDAQVNKGLAHVVAMPISPIIEAAQPSAKAPPRPPAAARPSVIPPAPVAPPLAQSSARLDGSVLCAGCGKRFERHADAFCPKCGTARPQDAATA